MIKDILMRLKAKTDVTQGVATRHLAKKQMKQLIVAGQPPGRPVTAILGDELIEWITGYKVYYLGKDIATGVHNLAVFVPQNYSVNFKSKNQRTL